jgi:hypothetical protein
MLRQEEIEKGEIRGVESSCEMVLKREKANGD